MTTEKAPKIPPQFLWEEELERINWYKNDLQKGGWQTVRSSPEATYYIKMFALDDPTPLKVLFQWELPISGRVVYNAYRNLEERVKWDPAFSVEFLGETPEGGQVLHVPFNNMPWPFWDREWVVCQGDKELPEKNAWIVNVRETTHPSKPVRDDVVKVRNGGNFYYITASESHPDQACTFFGHTANDYQFSRWLPNFLKWSPRFWGNKIVDEFEKLRKGLIKTYAGK